MKLLKGKTIANKILANIKAGIEKQELKPALAVVLIGENKASKLYVKLKAQAAKKVGINFYLYKFKSGAREKEILGLIRKLNEDKKINGIIVQLPLPSGFNAQKIINRISPRKDVDGFSVGGESLPAGQSGALGGHSAEFCLKPLPVFPKAIISLLESSGEKMEGKSAAVLAKSQKFATTMKEALKRKKIRPKIFLLKNPQRKMDFLKNFDIVISACGYPKIIKGEMLKKNAIVVDGGITKKGKKVLGDADFDSIKKVAGYCSPVPGGVGPVTVATLLENVCKAFRAQRRN